MCPYPGQSVLHAPNVNISHQSWKVACHFTETAAHSVRQKLICRITLMHYFQRGHWCHLEGTHTRLTALYPGLPGSAGTRKVKSIWILLKQDTVRGSGIRWAICKSASRSRQTTTPVPHHSTFYRPDALPAAQPTVSKHWWHWCHLKGIQRKPENGQSD